MIKIEFNESPTQFYSQLSNLLRINLIIKRDDLFGNYFGSTKGRKLAYILGEAKQKGYNAIVTTGSPYSNHIREATLYSLKLGWPIINIIHVDKINETIISKNFNLLQYLGVNNRVVIKQEVKSSMETAIKELREHELNPLYIWGGGHCLEGTYALYDAVFKLKKQLNGVKPDFAVVASGTGGTQAGLEVGFRDVYPKCKVLGISVARSKDRGEAEIVKSIKDLNNYLSNKRQSYGKVFFDDNWIGDDYGLFYPELLKIIKWAARTEGLLLDPIYTGKAFTALVNYVENGLIPQGSNVLFWHTGGLINFLDTIID